MPSLEDGLAFRLSRNACIRRFASYRRDRSERVVAYLRASAHKLRLEIQPTADRDAAGVWQ